MYTISNSLIIPNMDLDIFWKGRERPSPAMPKHHFYNDSKAAMACDLYEDSVRNMLPTPSQTPPTDGDSNLLKTLTTSSEWQLYRALHFATDVS